MDNSFYDFGLDSGFGEQFSDVWSQNEWGTMNNADAGPSTSHTGFAPGPRGVKRERSEGDELDGSSRKRFEDASDRQDTFDNEDSFESILNELMYPDQESISNDSVVYNAPTTSPQRTHSLAHILNDGALSTGIAPSSLVLSPSSSSAPAAVAPEPDPLPSRGKAKSKGKGKAKAASNVDSDIDVEALLSPDSDSEVQLIARTTLATVADAVSNDIEPRKDANLKSKAAASSSSSQPKPKPELDESTLLSSYTCPVCFSPPTNATLTPCGHICCGACLFSAVKSTIKRAGPLGVGPDGGPRCPVCRAIIPGWDGKGGGVIGLKMQAVFSF
ncbi:hypothetical protein VKT23_016099 [Stygiomarasmius scandens]|uniref:RING-type domain-containing protein n=1 Tax=Marasmiellus scandens TaxID=2682957 RepID=A0ABR1J0A0_9AGAR